jgi:Glycosyltransferase family 87
MHRLLDFSRRSERGLLVFGLAAVVYLGGFELLHYGFYRNDVITDTPVYINYGGLMRQGELPYRDFAVEYPPGALAAFVAPTFFGRNYDETFWWMMGALGVAGLACVALSRAGPAAVGFVAISPLLIGSYLPTRFDLWPTALLVAALVCLLRDRHRLGWALLGAAFTVKLFPFVVVPLAAIWTARRAGRRELCYCLAIGAAVVAAVFGPFAILAAHGLYESLWGEFSRPLQIESLPAAVIMTFGHPHVILSHGSLNLSGEGALAAIVTAASAISLLAIWVAFARGPIDAARFARLAAACVCAFVAFGKVLSPQFMIWLVPLVALTRGRRGFAAASLLAAALIDTEVWFPERYWPYVYHAHLAWLVLLRDLLLVALLGVLSLPGFGLLRSSSLARQPRTRRALPRSEPLPQQPRACRETP